MSFFQALILGIIQGLTEFIPISSTAHLTLTGKLFGLIDPKHPEAWTAFIAVMQLGTLVAVLIFFYKDIIGMARALIHDLKTNGSGKGFRGFSRDTWLALYIALGTIPIVVAGIFFRDEIGGMFTKNTYVIIGSLVILASLLWLAERIATHKKTIYAVTAKDAILIGCAQVLALIPGSSRSGTTITAGLFLNMTREAAARFSFLLSIPAILGSGVYEMTKIGDSLQGLGVFNLVVASVVSAISGYAAIAWLLRFLSHNSTMVFVWYRFGLGALLTVMLIIGWIQP